MINKVILIGNVGSDPEVRIVGESKVAKINLATSETFKGKDGEKRTATEWHKCEFWGSLATLVESYVKKGSKLYVEGKIEYKSYEKDGKTQYFTGIKGKELRFLDSKGNKVEDTKPEAEPNFDNTDEALPF